MRSAMRAASQLPGKGPTDVDDAPAHAGKSKSDYDDDDCVNEARQSFQPLNLIFFVTSLFLKTLFEGIFSLINIFLLST